MGPLLFSLLTIGLAAVVSPALYFLYKFTTKEKSFEEAIAEQRKQLAKDHSGKLKTKNQQMKKTKNEAKVSEKRNKFNALTTIPNAKKKETAKVNSSGVERTDENVTVSKRKNDKTHSKSGAVKENYDDSASTVSAGDANDDNNNSKKNYDFNSNSPTDANNGVFANEQRTTIENETNSTTKEKTAAGVYQKSSKHTQSSENVEKSKPGLSETLEKRDAKRHNSKAATVVDAEDKAGGKASTKMDERNVKESKSTTKLKSDDKVKSMEGDGKNEKMHSSPVKHKKMADTDVVDGVTATNDEQSDADGVKEQRKTEDVKTTESVIVKENIKPEKTHSPKTNAKKSNGDVVSANAIVTNGKMSPVPTVKGQKSSGNNNSKMAKKQAVESKSWQKMNYESNGSLNVNALIPQIAKTDLSHSDIQNLIDLLLNKQQESSNIDAEWIEGGRQDPVVKLKKQLAEKEKALSDEQEAHQAIQNKLKELRTELNAEKHANRELAETINARQADLQTLNTRMQTISDEKQNFVRQVQQLQAKLNEERMAVRSLKEENSKTKTNLQQELLAQRQQLEMHIARLNEQHQQELMSFENQLNQYASQLHDHEANNAHINEELRECALLRDRLVLQDNQIAHFQQTVMQLEESRAIKAELERHLANSQYEVTRLNSELKSLTDQLNKRNSDIERLNCTIQNMKIENQELIKENSRNNEQIKYAYNETSQLQAQVEKLNNELKAMEERHGVTDADSFENELQSYRDTIEKNNDEISRLSKRIAELEESKEHYVSRNAVLEEQNKCVEEIKDNLQKQWKKNDEIKTKEREEVLQRLKRYVPSNDSTSSTSKTGATGAQGTIAVHSTIDILTEDEAWYAYIEKLLREIRGTTQVCLVEPVERYKEMLDELKTQNKQLESRVCVYKVAIADTLGIMTSLQNKVENEENDWRKEIQRLEAQIEKLQSELKATTEERNLLMRATQIENGCADADSEAQKVNGIDKITSSITVKEKVLSNGEESMMS